MQERDLRQRFTRRLAMGVFSVAAIGAALLGVLHRTEAREREMLERTTGKRVARPGATQQIELPFGEGAPARGHRPRPRRSSKQG